MRRASRPSTTTCGFGTIDPVAEIVQRGWVRCTRHKGDPHYTKGEYACHPVAECLVLELGSADRAPTITRNMIADYLKDRGWEQDNTGYWFREKHATFTRHWTEALGLQMTYDQRDEAEAQP
jgi:hypothetical protein